MHGPMNVKMYFILRVHFVGVLKRMGCWIYYMSLNIPNAWIWSILNFPRTLFSKSCKQFPELSDITNSLLCKSRGTAL
jgi:hypothetical protein